MLASDQIEELICIVSSWDRQTLVEQFHAFGSSFPIDFTPEFMQAVSVEKLRHVFLAMCLQNNRMPESALAA